MKFFSRSASHAQRLPVTNVLSLLDNQLLLFLRTWGSAEHNQKFVDEVMHYLSSTQADLDVTTPFDYQENLSALANRTRVSLLLAHDYFYRNENKNEYLVGFEATALFCSKGEVAWSSVGRFAVGKIEDDAIRYFFNNGTDLDSECLFPVQLIGIEREIDISSGSMKLENAERAVVVSNYKNDLVVNLGSKTPESSLEIKNAEGSCWYSVVTSE